MYSMKHLGIKDVAIAVKSAKRRRAVTTFNS